MNSKFSTQSDAPSTIDLSLSGKPDLLAAWLENMTEQRLDAEIEEIHNWLDIARYRANFVNEMDKKMRKIRKALVDEKQRRTGVIKP